MQTAPATHPTDFTHSAAVLTHRVHDAIPPLSWLLDWRGDRGVLHCGSGVEMRDDAWFEGVWAGDFEAWDFDRVPDVFGSGGLCRDGYLHLVAPSHCLEPLFLMQDGGRLLAANSLAFLLSYADSGIVADDFSYAERFLDVLHGIDHLRFGIPCLGGTVQVVYHFNVEVGPGGAAGHVAKPPSPPFPAYADYIGHVTRISGRLLANASSLARRYRFEPLSTLSKGYDSPACAIIARTAGCRDAVTFESSLDREGSRQLDDCGLEIGQRLGLRVSTYRRELPPHASEEDFSQFFCDGGLGGEMYWLAMAGDLPGKALVTGILGGQVWGRFEGARTLFEKNDCAGIGLGEFRRRLGFAHIPLPYIASTRLANLLDISRSPEMAPWSIGGEYDKPIARRIVEEAGIPRSAFGQTKTGNSFRAWYPDHWPDRFLRPFRLYRKDHPMTVQALLRYGLRLARLQVLRFSCERRFLKQLAGWLSPAGDSQTLVYPLLEALSGLLRQALRPLGPPPYKIIIRMHPRYTHLLAWATANAARRYASVRPADAERAG